MLKASRLGAVAFATIALSFSAIAKDIKFGVIAATTGPGAAWGVAVAEGARLAIEDVNAAGGLDIKGTKTKVELIVYDDQYKASEHVSAYNRLVNEGGVKYMLTMGSAGVLAAKNNIEADNVLVLTTAYSQSVIRADAKHIIRALSTPADYVPGVVSWMRKNVPGKRIVVVNPNDETGWDLANVSAAALAREGYDILARELYERSQKDFLPLLTRVIALKPDIIELGSTSPSTAGLIVRQARELGYKNTFSALGGPGPLEIVAAAGKEAAEGMVNVLYADPSNAAYRALSERFRKTHAQAPNEFIVPCYDATRVLLRAIEIAGDPPEVDAVIQAFSKALPMKSLQGQELVFGGRNTIGIDAQIMTVNYIGTIRRGEPVVVGLSQ